ncbi:MAG: PAS domain S-box protein [Firmicutes bacterium]|nr:PAS domain S-box protein [Bacillota bacterium]
MPKENRSRDQLLSELDRLRQRLAALENAPDTRSDPVYWSSLELFESPVWVQNLQKRRSSRPRKNGAIKVQLPDKHLRTVFDAAPVGIAIATDTSCRVIRHNPAAARFLRINPGDNFSFSSPTPPPVQVLHRGRALRPDELPIQRAAWYGEEVTEQEIEFVWEDGVKKTALWNAGPLFSEDGEIIGAIGAFEDITQRKQAEEARRESEERYRALAERLRDVDLPQSEERFYKVFNSNPTATIITRLRDDVILNVNDNFSNLFGYHRDELVGRTPYEMRLWESPEKRRSLVDFLLINSQVDNLEIRLRKKNGGTIIGLGSFSTIELNDERCMIAAVIDITERKRIEKEIARLDQLNLVGEMAASIGHEIRNPMTTIRGFLQMVSEREDSERYREYYQLMIEELDRANAIITEYLSMARDKAVDLKPGCLNSTIMNLYPLLKADAQYGDKQVKLALGHLPPFRFDQKEIRQLIMNLVRNGLEAMPSGGTLTIGTWVEDGIVTLYIEDQGGGLDPAVIEKLGTPFVTTKDNGTGLGLAVCYSIARRHDAEIKVDTSPRGTTFSVCFKAEAD